MKKLDRNFLDPDRPRQQDDVHLKDYELVINHYRKFIAENVDCADAYVNLGFIYLDKEDYDEALRCFQKIVELEPDHPEAHNNLGYVYEKMDMFDSAKKCYEQALALNDNDIEAFINIAHIMELQGDYFGAVKQYKNAINSDSRAIAPRRPACPAWLTSTSGPSASPPS